MAEMNAALKAEGQRTLIIGDRVAIRDEPNAIAGMTVKRWVNTYTSNADGSLGFNLEGDKPMGQVSDIVCVAGKFTNIRLYDARNAGTPPEAKKGGNFDLSLRDNEAKGTRPMLQADAIATAPDGTVRIGNGITLFWNVKRESAYLVVNYPDGEAADLLQMSTTRYTPTALERLNTAKSRP